MDVGGSGNAGGGGPGVPTLLYDPEGGDWLLLPRKEAQGLTSGIE